MPLAQGRVAILLEGGYNLESISHSMTMCAKALLRDPLPSPRIEPVNPEALRTIRRVVRHHLPYWSSLCFHIDLPDEDVLKVDEKVVSLEDKVEQLQLDTDSQVETSIEGLDEASGYTEPITTEPKTLQEFLLLPENVEVYCLLSPLKHF